METIVLYNYTTIGLVLFLWYTNFMKNAINIKISTVSEELKNLILNDYELKQNLIVVYLFGSLVKGSRTESSDIDIAFVFDENFYKKEPFRAVQKSEFCSTLLSERLGCRVDIVILNSASLSFVYHVLKRGICIYEKNSSKRILFEVKIDNLYHDFRPFIDELRKVKRQALYGGN